MTISKITYRDYLDGPWTSEPPPGPLPQAHSRQFPTSRTYCTCGHPGPSHARQTLTTPPWRQGDALRFRGTCRGWMSVTGQWMMCLCTWFVEDTDTLKAEHEMREEEAKRDAKRRKLGKYDVT